MEGGEGEGGGGRGEGRRGRLKTIATDKTNRPKG